MIDYAEASEKRTVFGTFAVCFTEASVCRGMRAFAQGGRAGECSESLLDCCAMTEANESADITVEEEVVAAPEMSTVERAEMLLN